MNKKVKSLLLVLCALVFAVAGVFATLAYLQDDDEIINEVTIGDITMNMDEGTYNDIDPYTGAVDFSFTQRQSEGNEYHLLPAVTYPKDPTIHIAKESEPCYVFVQVLNGLADLEVDAAADTEHNLPAGTIEKQMLANNWVKVTDYDNLWVYAGGSIDGRPNIVDAREAAVDLQVFGQFKVNENANNMGDSVDALNIDKYEDSQIIVRAMAIQTVGFATYEAALDQLPDSWGY